MHLSVKSGAKGKGAAHAQYIEREGKYANRGDLVYSESGNMPTYSSLSGIFKSNISLTFSISNLAESMYSASDIF